MRNILTIGIFLIAIGLVLALSLNRKPEDPLAFNPPDIPVSSNLTNPDGNVLWITVEGMRPDHIGAYGYQNVTTPRIDSLASESLVFERCYAQSTETFRSVATMLSSRYPNTYPGGSKENAGRGFRDLLSNPQNSLVNLIRDSGHTTAAIVGSPVLKSNFGFGEGFDYFDDKPTANPDGSIRTRTTEETYKVAENWLSRNFRRPFFVFVHLPDPLGPYDPNASNLAQLHTSASYLDSKTLFVAEGDNRPVNALPSYFGQPGDEHTVGDLTRLYDGEIVEVDYYIGELVNLLSRLEIDDKTMVVISGTHGESLGEHGTYFSYGGSTFNCLSSIPLIIHNPRGGAGLITDVVEGIDVMPTVLSYLGIDKPPKIDGMNLLPFYENSFPKRQFPAFCYWDSPSMISVIKGKYELVNFDEKEFKLYQIMNDPAEIYDLYSDNDPTVLDLMPLMEIWNRQNREKALEIELNRKAGPDGRKSPMITPANEALQPSK